MVLKTIALKLPNLCHTYLGMLIFTNFTFCLFVLQTSWVVVNYPQKSLDEVLLATLFACSNTSIRPLKVPVPLEKVLTWNICSLVFGLISDQKNLQNSWQHSHFVSLKIKTNQRILFCFVYSKV